MPQNSTHKSAFEALFRSEYARLVRVSTRLSRDQALSEDVVQGVFIKFYEQNGLQHADKPAAYLRRAVVTRTFNALRDRKRTEHPGDVGVTSAAEQFESSASDDLADTKEKLHTAINQLPERARLILMLHRFEGYTYKEIAVELNIAPKTVENQLARALKLLRASMPKLLSIYSFINFTSL